MRDSSPVLAAARTQRGLCGGLLQPPSWRRLPSAQGSLAPFSSRLPGGGGLPRGVLRLPQVPCPPPCLPNCCLRSLKPARSQPLPSLLPPRILLSPSSPRRAAPCSLGRPPRLLTAQRCHHVTHHQRGAGYSGILNCLPDVPTRTSHRHTTVSKATPPPRSPRVWLTLLA